ncbi:MAG: hypothetical protein GY926_19425 [bacterium]|nr:hypothetical protein [bacterium]
MSDPITDDQIDALETEAGEHGDLEMVAICRRARDGSKSARQEVARCIDAARAMDDGRSDHGLTIEDLQALWDAGFRYFQAEERSSERSSWSWNRDRELGDDWIHCHRPGHFDISASYSDLGRRDVYTHGWPSVHKAIAACEIIRENAMALRVSLDALRLDGQNRKAFLASPGVK